MNEDRIRGIVAVGAKRGWLSHAELIELRGALHKERVPPDIVALARQMVSGADSNLFRQARGRRSLWRR